MIRFGNLEVTGDHDKSVISGMMETNISIEPGSGENDVGRLSIDTFLKFCCIRNGEMGCN